MEDVKKKIKQNKINFKKDIQPEIKRWIVKMLNVYPKQRPDVKDVLADPFFNRHRRAIEESQAKGLSPLTTGDLGSRPSKPVPAKKMIMFNSLRAIKEQDSAKNSLENSIDSSGNVIPAKAGEDSTGAKAFHSHQKVFGFDSFKKHQDGAHQNFQKQILIPRSGFSGQSGAFSNGGGGGHSGGLKQNSGPPADSGPGQYLKGESFKKKPGALQVDYKDAERAQGGFKYVESKTLDLQSLGRKLVSGAKFADSKKKTLGYGLKKNFNVVSSNGATHATDKKFVARFKASKSPMAVQKKPRVYFRSEQKPVTGFKWQARAAEKKPPAKWVPGKFGSSAYHNSKLGAKLISSNQTHAVGGRVVRAGGGLGRFLRKPVQKQTTQSTLSGRLLGDTAKRNLIQVSRGQPSGSAQSNAPGLHSESHPKGAASGFQKQRVFASFGTKPSEGAPQGAKQGSFEVKRKFFSTSSQQGARPNFLKKAPFRSFVKFLEPKIIRKDFAKKESFGGNRIVINRNDFNGTAKFGREKNVRHLSNKTD